MDHAYATLAGIGSAQPANAKLSPAMPFEEIVSRVSDAAKDVSYIANEAHALADRLFGDRPPSPTGTSGVSPVRSGYVGSARDALDYLESQLADLRQAHNRVAGIA